LAQVTASTPGSSTNFCAERILTTCLAYGNLCGAFSITDCGGTEAFRDAARMQEFLRRHDASNQAQ
jgi:sugar/nucleoside kinase (ribokinase family)